MEFKEKYKNFAHSEHPATIIFLVDNSYSMRASMPDGKTRIDLANEAIQSSYDQMIENSLRQGIIYPRYRVGIVVYSNVLYDVYGNMGSIVTVDKLKDQRIPSFTLQHGTDMAKAFHYASKLIQDDIKKWSQKWLDECPPPIVVNITDCEYEQPMQDPSEYVQNLREISVTDGNVLITNILITDQISLPNTNVKGWQGYRYSDSTGNPNGDRLLAMSSLIPATYIQIINEQTGLKVSDGTYMTFPGISREFIMAGFAISIGTGSQLSQLNSMGNIKSESFPAAREFSDAVARKDWELLESLLARARKAGIVDDESRKRVEVYGRILYHAMQPKTKKGWWPSNYVSKHEGGRPSMNNEKISSDQKVRSELEKVKKSLKISIAYPELLSKRYESSFLVQVYLPEERSKVIRNIKSEFREQQTSERMQPSLIEIEQKIRIKFYSPKFDFSDPEPKFINRTLTKFVLIGIPKDDCESGVHKVLVTILDVESNLEIESLTINVTVIDFAFDHVSRPMLSRISAFALGVGSFAMFILTVLEQIDKTIGLTSGTAAGVLAAVVYANFYNLYQRIRSNTP